MLQAMSDKARGSLMLLAVALAFLYYTFWTLLLVRIALAYALILISLFERSQPFFDESSPIHSWFPSREWAVRIPAFITVFGISAIGLFLGVRIVNEGSRGSVPSQTRSYRKKI